MGDIRFLMFYDIDAFSDNCKFEELVFTMLL
jgi:hypothetical protein